MQKARKFLTFSYDDGIAQDIRLIKLLEKYGMRGTFHICSARAYEADKHLRDGATVYHGKIPACEISKIYDGHEVAAHTRSHVRLPELSDEEIVREVEEDRLALSELVGYEVVGLAYPYGVRDERVIRLINEKTGVRYARTSAPSFSFNMPTDIFAIPPSARHSTDEHWDKLFKLGEQFISLECDSDTHFCVMGHTYEFDIHNTWDKFESFLKMMSGHPDITYSTIKEAVF